MAFLLAFFVVVHLLDAVFAAGVEGDEGTAPLGSFGGDAGIGHEVDGLGIDQIHPFIADGGVVEVVVANKGRSRENPEKSKAWPR